MSLMRKRLSHNLIALRGRLNRRLEAQANRELLPQLPQWHLHEGMVVGNTGLAEAGLRVRLPAATLITDVLRDTYAGQLRTLLNALIPEGGRFRLTVRVSPANEVALAGYAEGLRSGDAVSQTVTQARLEHFREASRSGLLVDREVYASVTFGHKRPFQAAYTERELEAYLREGQLLQERLGLLLSRCGWEARPMSSAETFALMYRYLNPDEERVPVPSYAPSWQTYPADLLRAVPEVRPPTLRAALGRYTVDNTDKDRLRVGRSYVRMLNLFTQPDAVPRYSGEALWHALVGKGNCWLVLDLHKLYQELTVQSLKTQARTGDGLQKLAESKGELVDSRTKRANNAVQGLLDHLENSGDHLFSAGLAVVLLHPDPQSLDRLVEATLTDLNALPGRPFVPVEGGLIPFMALSPFSTLSNDERVTLTSGNCANLIPKMGAYSGLAGPVATTYLNRHGTLTGFDLFDPRAQSGNYAIAGPNGSGKSVAAQRLLADHLRDPETDVFTVDVKDTYRELNLAYNGDSNAYVRISLDADVAINPLQLSPGALSPDPEQLAFQTRVIHRMAVPSPELSVRAHERSLISQAILSAFSYRTQPVRQGEGEYRDVLENPTLGDVDRMLAARLRDPNVREDDARLIHNLRRRLEPWLEGAAGSLFNRRSTLDIPRRRVVSFDLEGISQDENLCRVTMPVLGYLIQQKTKNLARNTVINIDEAWRVLDDDDGAEMVETLARTSRSYRGVVGLVVHELKDLARPGIRSTLHNLLLFRCDGAAEFVTDYLELPAHLGELVGGLGFVKDQYTEALLLARRGGQESGQWEGGVVVITQSPKERWLFSQHGPHKLRREAALKRTGGDLWAALDGLEKEGM